MNNLSASGRSRPRRVRHRAAGKTDPRFFLPVKYKKKKKAEKVLRRESAASLLTAPRLLHLKRLCQGPGCTSTPPMGAGYLFIVVCLLALIFLNFLFLCFIVPCSVHPREGRRLVRASQGNRRLFSFFFSFFYLPTMERTSVGGPLFTTAECCIYLLITLFSGRYNNTTIQRE